ncbi:hypothetical protein EXW93_06020 [Exiguobacterium sp. JMULE1]|uniref:hypothetical protein n=1 Tax=Exiguobacterium sp. JMULE1 TaxID=2518339 RepID=UPI001574FC77|nr:hypothetical protein [Exiguobacterium sp. JMULE1]NTY09151.1 hypothetical protein [Exiguobacterium sp. JMULE1]
MDKSIRKKRIFYSLVFLVSGSILLATWMKVQQDRANATVLTRSSITAIDFSPQQDTVMLVYPGQGKGKTNDPELAYSSIVTINMKGQVLNERQIHDPAITNMTLVQKPSTPNVLYASGAGYPNHFHTFDFTKRRFVQHSVTYFKHDPMMESIKHFGPNTWFKTLNSYKTGMQRSSQGTGFSHTFSNFDTKENYETPARFEPGNSMMIELKQHLAYASIGSEDEQEEKAAMIFLDKRTEKPVVYRKRDEPYAYSALYGKDDAAYFASTDGWMIRINESGEQTERYYPFLQNTNFDSTDPIRMIDATQGIQVVQQFSHDNQNRDRHILVKWSFGQSFSVQKIKPKFWKADKWYKYLYIHPKTKKSYFIEFDPEHPDKGKLLITNKKYELLHEMPVEGPIGIDFVIE